MLTRRGFLANVGAAVLAGSPSRFQRSGAVDAASLSPGTHPLELDRVRDGILYVPKSYDPGVPSPLVLMFHGAGSSGLNCQYAFPSADEYGFLILAPDSRSELTWDLVLGSYGPDLEFIEAAFQQTVKRVAVDRRRMSIAGHSDGASYALSFGIGVGDIFGHLIALSPGVMTPIAAKGHPKIFIAHGVNDPTMPIDDTSRKFVPRLKNLGYDVTYREYDGGHGAPAPLVHDAFEWMMR